MTKQSGQRDDKLSIVFINSIFVRRDAISNTLYDRVLHAASHPDAFDYHVFCYATDYPAFNVQTVCNAQDILKSAAFRNADIIVIEFGIYHDLFDVVLCETAAAKLVSYHNVTSSWLFEPGPKRELCERSELQSWNLAFADHVVCNSGFTRDEAIGYGVPSELTSVIAPSVPAGGGAEIRKSQTGPVEILYVGRLVPQKGLLDLVEALTALSQTVLPEWRLNIVGAMKFSDPAYVRLLNKKITESGLAAQVNFLGELSETQIEQAFAQAHILVTPSYHEGFGVPIIEALANHCVVVCSDAGSLPEIAGPFGHTFKCGDDQMLARQLAQVLRDLRPEDALPRYRVGGQVITEAEYNAAADAYVRPFLPKAAVARFYDLVAELTAQKKLAAAKLVEGVVSKSNPAVLKRVWA